jgi:hypothetical protein
MSCLPKSGGCEKAYIDPFVAYLNEFMGTKYLFRNCLDANDSSTPQPETLYEDCTRGRQLVIERKSISWPSDYPYRHSNDHFVADLFSKELSDISFADSLYEISLPLLINGTEKELQPFVLAATATIRRMWPEVVKGKMLRRVVNDRWWWGFRQVPNWDREDDEPKKGLRFSWVGKSITQLGDFVDPNNLPEQLVCALNKIFSSCMRKFRPYSHAVKILVLDPHGDLRHKDVDWWQQVFTNQLPPVEIGEIWSGTFDWIDNYSRGWMFERLHCLQNNLT